MTSLGLLLAAGPGTRYGGPKILASDGRWLSAAVDALIGGGCDEVLVVVGAAEPEMPEGATAVVNTAWRDGMGSSLATGLARAAAGTADRVVIHLVDTPDIGADVVRRVLDASTRTGTARAIFEGRPGHPVVVPRSSWTAIVDAAVGDQGGRGFLRRNPDVVLVECGDLATGRDIDVPERHPASTDPSSTRSSTT